MIQPHKPDPTVLTNTLLYLDGVEVAFDGYRALRGLSLIVGPGEMLAIIGPNGAGKTTMMDVITGKTRPGKGDVLFEGRIDLTKRDEADIAQLGIGRKFQKPTVFESQTIEDNLLLALNVDHRVRGTLFWRETKDESERIERVLETIRLTDARNRLAGSLSHGQKQWLEIGMLLAQDPKLLLVDEPVAGMTDVETETTAQVLREIARMIYLEDLLDRPAETLSHGQKQWLEIGMLLIQDPELLMLDEPVAGMSVSERARTAELLKEIIKNRSVIVIEHDMKFVEDIAHKVTVLHQGQILSEGTMEKVQNDPKVIEVYLGH